MREQRSLAATSDNTTGGLLSAVVVLLLTLPGVAGCMEAREDVTRPVTSCKGCHGDSKSLAPPTGVWLNGKKQTTYRGVGAHRVHLAATLSAPITCKTCHTVPDRTSTQLSHWCVSTQMVCPRFAGLPDSWGEWPRPTILPDA